MAHEPTTDARHHRFRRARAVTAAIAGSSLIGGAVIVDIAAHASTRSTAALSSTGTPTGSTEGSSEGSAATGSSATGTNGSSSVGATYSAPSSSSSPAGVSTGAS